MSKWRCKECGWLGTDSDFLQAPHPFQGNGTSGGPQIYGCPNCKEADQFVMTCDEIDCTRDVSCGWPSPHGYRNTCSDHYSR